MIGLYIESDIPFLILFKSSDWVKEKVSVQC